MEKLVLIDGNSLLNRAFYATNVFTTQAGFPTNAIFGFLKLLFKIQNDLKPEYIVVAFDMRAPTFRHKKFDAYKAGRKPMPEELAVQVEPLKELLRAMNIAIYQQEGIEADDIIGTLSTMFHVYSYVYTGDRDSYQLVDSKTEVRYTKRGVTDLLILNEGNFEEVTTILPKQIIDLKALMGDKSDNIPGVPGIGEKTAYNLIHTYHSLENIYANIDSLKGSLQSKLIENEALAYLSYDLATINRSCNINLQLEDCKWATKYSLEVKKLFVKYEFKSLLALDIFEEANSQPAEGNNQQRNVEKFDVIKSDDLLLVIKSNRELYVLLGEDNLRLYVKGKQYNVALPKDLLSAGISYDEFIVITKAIFSSKDKKVITYNYKDVLHKLEKMEIEVCCDFEDLSLMIYLVDYTNANVGLNQLIEFKDLSIEFDAYSLYLLHAEYFAKLKIDDLLELYLQIEKPLLLVLYRMESLGVKVDVNELNNLGDKYLSLLEDIKQIIFNVCGCTFNINSPKQIGEMLFDKLGLKGSKKGKNGAYSTSAEILEGLVNEHEVIPYILKYRQYQKLYSTYIEGFKPLIEKSTSLIHTTYNQTITATGRLSSTNPNLQNIPIRDEDGKELRKMFVPRDGYVFIDADYSQIELRLLAHFSGCKELIEAYNNNADIHATTASQIFNVPFEEVTDQMRRSAKAVNFGIIYGISEYGLSKNLNISVKQAKEYIAKYFEIYSSIKDYMQSNVDFAKENGYVSTLLGRKRYIPEIKSSNYNMRQFGERAAMNMPLQGSSADIIKIAMINVYNALKKNNLKSQLILQVHDELVLDCPVEEREKAMEILKYEMENAVKLLVPLTVDVHFGENWYEAK